MTRLAFILLVVAYLMMAFVAQMYRNQRDDLAAAWLHFHPEDFPDLTEDDV